eukprot:2321438-Amphidinium_carterae.1
MVTCDLSDRLLSSCAWRPTYTRKASSTETDAGHCGDAHVGRECVLDTSSWIRRTGGRLEPNQSTKLVQLALATINGVVGVSRCQIMALTKRTKIDPWEGHNPFSMHRRSCFVCAGPCSLLHMWLGKRSCLTILKTLLTSEAGRDAVL